MDSGIYVERIYKHYHKRYLQIPYKHYDSFLKDGNADDLKYGASFLKEIIENELSKNI